MRATQPRARLCPCGSHAAVTRETARKKSDSDKTRQPRRGCRGAGRADGTGSHPKRRHLCRAPGFQPEGALHSRGGPGQRENGAGAQSGGAKGGGASGTRGPRGPAAGGLSRDPSRSLVLLQCPKVTASDGGRWRHGMEATRGSEAQAREDTWTRGGVVEIQRTCFSARAQGGVHGIEVRVHA